MAVSISTTTQAVDALLKWKSTQSTSQNPQLLPEDDFIYLILTLKKIPQKGAINGPRTNPNKIPLPHPLISQSSFPEICLIIDDRPNSNLTSKIAKKKIKSEGIPVTKVIKISKLKTDYKPFESKRKLCDSYEMFFADRRVIPLLPKLLGKQFFKKKKIPLAVDLGHKNWKEQIERGCSSALLFFGTGTCSVVRVAKVSMERDEIVENVGCAIDGVVGFVPKRFGGVRSLHLKFSESVALPLYQSLPDIKLRIEGLKEEKDLEVVENEGMEIDEGEGEGEVVENDEVGSAELVGKKRKGGMNGEKGAKKKGGRVHEVDLEIEEIEKDDVGSAELVGKKRKGELNAEKPTKKKGGKVHEVDSVIEEIEKDDVGSAELVGKKRKGGLNAEKPTKKKGGKVHEVDSVIEEIEKDDLGSAELVGKKRKGEVKGLKVEKKIGKEKKGAKSDGDSGKKERKGVDVKPILGDKKVKKKVEKQSGDGKKKGRSVGRV
ncbi:hypothetical protein OSB04_025517 [Centaurea solstitialis]|uniref:Ribosomal protein L1 n=1 Tax=Centaurea solstitialis TaxID=347529 RepID=A0AA38WBD3_9ASTR|nr:hypothetical protein OSB04_025517 [Centaurea solstitialis]